jgi:hypothetical protein
LKRLNRDVRINAERLESCAGRAQGGKTEVNMKAFLTVAAVVGLIALFLTNAPPAFARNGWGLEDPQLCVNGELLTVIPAAPSQVFVQVPMQATVDYAVENCGGDPTEGVVPSSNVNVQGANQMSVAAQVPDGTTVIFNWGGTTATVVSKNQLAKAKFATK